MNDNKWTEHLVPEIGRETTANLNRKYRKKKIEKTRQRKGEEKRLKPVSERKRCWYERTLNRYPAVRGEQCELRQDDEQRGGAYLQRSRYRNFKRILCSTWMLINLKISTTTTKGSVRGCKLSKINPKRHTKIWHRKFPGKTLKTFATNYLPHSQTVWPACRRARIPASRQTFWRRGSWPHPNSNTGRRSSNREKTTEQRHLWLQMQNSSMKT